MWQIKIFKTEKSMLSFLKKNGNKIEFQEIFVNNGFGIEFRKLKVIDIQ